MRPSPILEVLENGPILNVPVWTVAISLLGHPLAQFIEVADLNHQGVVPQSLGDWR